MKSSWAWNSDLDLGQGLCPFAPKWYHHLLFLNPENGSHVICACAIEEYICRAALILSEPSLEALFPFIIYNAIWSLVTFASWLPSYESLESDSIFPSWTISISFSPSWHYHCQDDWIVPISHMSNLFSEGLPSNVIVFLSRAYIVNFLQYTYAKICYRIFIIDICNFLICNHYILFLNALFSNIWLFCYIFNITEKKK